MKFIPILFSTPMVQAINEGRKTMTRRGIKQKDQPYLQYDNSFVDYSDGFGWVVKHQIEGDPARFEITQQMKCPYGNIGDVLWVRESYSTGGFLTSGPGYIYKANGYPDGMTKWKPSIHMPKAACRTFLEITNIRIERLQDITEQDSIAEGVEKSACGNHFAYYSSNKNFSYVKAASAYTSFCSLWQSINGLDSWNGNPFVWVISFKRIEKPENFK